jgi:hypothetical protein
MCSLMSMIVDGQANLGNAFSRWVSRICYRWGRAPLLRWSRSSRLGLSGSAELDNRGNSPKGGMKIVKDLRCATRSYSDHAGLYIKRNTAGYLLCSRTEEKAWRCKGRGMGLSVAQVITHPFVLLRIFDLAVFYRSLYIERSRHLGHVSYR